MGHQAQMVAVDSVDEAVGRAADPRRLFRNASSTAWRLPGALASARRI
jgi:hypothetical protein